MRRRVKVAAAQHVFRQGVKKLAAVLDVVLDDRAGDVVSEPAQGLAAGEGQQYPVGAERVVAREPGAASPLASNLARIFKYSF